jgi:hypothetical protein
MAVFAPSLQFREEDVAIALRRPARGLSDERYVKAYRAALLDGADPVTAVDAMPIDQPWRKEKLAASFAALSRHVSNATEFIRTLRRDGLDEYYDQHAAGALAADASDHDVLDRCQQDAAGMTVAAYNLQLEEWAGVLRKACAPGEGIEVTTIHRAKGRQWPKVVVVAMDEGVLPHKAALMAGDSEGEEGERRVAYVAMTRAVDELSLLYTVGRHSRFLHEAGYVPAPAQRWEPPTPKNAGTGFWETVGTAPAGDPRGRPGANGNQRRPGSVAVAGGNGRTPLAKRLDDLERIGAAYALRNAPSRHEALFFAELLVTRSHHLARAATGRGLTVTELIDALDEVTDADKAALRRAAADRAMTMTPLRGLDDEQRRELAKTIAVVNNGG